MYVVCGLRDLVSEIDFLAVVSLRQNHGNATMAPDDVRRCLKRRVLNSIRKRANLVFEEYRDVVDDGGADDDNDGALHALQRPQPSADQGPANCQVAVDRHHHHHPDYGRLRH